MLSNIFHKQIEKVGETIKNNYLRTKIFRFFRTSNNIRKLSKAIKQAEKVSQVGAGKVAIVLYIVIQQKEKNFWKKNPKITKLLYCNFKFF